MLRPLYIKLILSAALIALLWLGIRFFLPVLLPFLLAGFLALRAEKSVSWMQNRLGLPRPAAALTGVMGVFLLLTALVMLLLGLLMRQLPRMTSLAPHIEQVVLSGRSLLKSWLLDKTEAIPGSIGLLLRQWAQSLFSDSSALLQPVLQTVPRMVTGIVGKLSQGIFGMLTGLIASVMLSIRLPRIRAWLQKKLPEGTCARYRSALSGFKSTLGKWLLAQGKLMAVTFSVLFMGFMLLGIHHAPLWAGLVALVDAFPILGVGTVLVPWSLVCLLQGQFLRGTGLLGLFVTCWLVRSVMEPRLVGKSLGLDPLLTLFAIYAGFQLWGIWGMLLAPMLAMTASQFYRAFLPSS